VTGPVKAYVKRQSKKHRSSQCSFFADQLDVHIEVEGLGSLKVDTAYGGDSFVIVNAAELGFEIKLMRLKI